MADVYFKDSNDVSWLDSPDVSWVSAILFETDFSEYATGSPPSDWSNFWSSSGFTYNVDDTDTLTPAIGTKYIDFDVTTAGRHVATWDDVGSVADVDLYVKFHARNIALSSNSYVRVYARVGGAATTEDCYFAVVGNEYIRIWKYVAGVSTEVAGVICGFNWSYSNFWVRFQLIGTALKLRVWDSRGVEPVDWTVEATDSDLASGRVGVGTYPTTGDFNVDFFSATVGGAATNAFPPSGFTPTRFGSFETTATGTTNAYLRCMGGQFGDLDKILSGIGCVVGTHSAQARIAVYTGGSLDTSPEGATLLHDFGLTTGTASNTALSLSGGDIVIPKNTPIWVMFKVVAGFGLRYSSEGVGNAGNFQTARGRYDIASGVSTDPATPFPATIPTITGSFFSSYYIVWATLDDAVVQTPEISPPSGVCSTDQLITITCSTSGSTIYYTEDGSTPTAASTEYTAPFTLGGAKTIKAIGVKAGFTDSPIASATYTIGDITLVGTAGDSAINLSSVSVTLPAGTQENDLVLVLYSCSNTTATRNPTTSGYTSIGSATSNDFYDTALEVFYKVMGATPDTTVDFPAMVSSGYSAAASVYVLRGVDTSNPIDVTSELVWGGNDSNPDAPSITPVTAGTWVLACGVSSSSSTAGTVPSGYSDQIAYAGGASYAISAYLCWKKWNGSGAENPAAWTNIPTNSNHSWSAATVAIRAGAATATATPEITPVSGAYATDQLITITCSTPSSTIYYTEDGSDPTAASTEYTAPFTLGAAKTIKAIGITAGLDDSPIASATYTIGQSFNIKLGSTDVSAIYLGSTEVTAVYLGTVQI